MNDHPNRLIVANCGDRLMVEAPSYSGSQAVSYRTGSPDGQEPKGAISREVAHVVTHSSVDRVCAALYGIQPDQRQCAVASAQNATSTVVTNKFSIKYLSISRVAPRDQYKLPWPYSPPRSDEENLRFADPLETWMDALDPSLQHRSRTRRRIRHLFESSD